VDADTRPRARAPRSRRRYGDPMPRFDAGSAEVLVFTFKEGLLSAVAHDLKLRVGRFEIEEAPDGVSARFDASSLRVVCARKEGADSPGALPGFAPAEIEKHIVDDVLDARRHPEVRFRSTHVSDAEVVGELTLHGRTREVRCVRRDDVGHLVAECRLDQREFGIRPYSAMLGTVKVKPEVVIRVRLPR
jgi:hypothetical protein